MRRKVLVLLLTLSLILSFTPMIAFADTEAEGSVAANETVEAEKTEPEEKAEPEEPVQDDVKTEEAEEPVDETAAVEEESAEDASQQTVAGHQALNAVASDPESDECEHENKYTEEEVDWENATYTQIEGDNSNHTATYLIEEVTYCEDCGEELSRKTVGKEEEEEEHEFINGECTLCGYKNTCTHGETSTYNSWDDDAEIDYTSIDDRFHKKMGSGEKVTECFICGEVLSREKTDQLEEEEEHDYDDNHKCVDCGHVNGCTHGETSTYNSWDDDAEIDYTSIDDRFHMATGIGEKVTECDICGEVLSREEATQLEVKEEHDYDDNHKCVNCGHENECTHKNTSTAEGERNWEKAVFEKIGNNKLHKVKCPVEILTVCDDCGEVVGTETVEDEDNYYHDYDSNGVCKECGYINNCEHKRQRVEYEWNDSDVKYDKLENDNTYHKVTGAGNRLTWCEDCEVLIKTEKVDNVDTTEVHSYDSNHICQYCGYQNKCKHSNTYTYNNWKPEDVHYDAINDTYHKVTGPGEHVTVCQDCRERFTTEVDNVDEEEYHDYNSAHKCRDCGHENKCSHPSKYFEYGYSSDRCIIEDLGNGSQHKVTGRIEKYTYCKVCEEELKEEVLGYKTVDEIHYYDENDTCWYCGYKRPTECVHEYDEGIVTSAPTCTDTGVKTYTCKKCKQEKTETIPALGHDWEKDPTVDKAATCTKAGLQSIHCTRCSETMDTKVIPALGHDWEKDPTVDKAATCTEAGFQSIHCTRCSETKDTKVIPALEHEYDSDGVCIRCGYKKTPDECAVHEYDDGIVTLEPTCTNAGVKTYTCKKCKKEKAEPIPALGHEYDSNDVCIRCGNKKPSEDEEDDIRIFGSDRYDTAFKVAERYKDSSGKFKNVIVAYGQGFADALSGGYLAKVKNAPILLVDQSRESDMVDYISKNLLSGGTVYILGGTAVVSSKFESALKKKGLKDPIRLGGKDRYETNIQILKAAGVKAEDILVCGGNGFADSLSASSVGKPILLVGNSLTDTQKDYIKNGLSSKQFYLIGGTGAVSTAVEAGLKTLLGVKPERLAGKDRYDTSAKVAKKFFPKATTVMLVWALNYPDGLSGGPLAMMNNAPVVLTEAKATAAAQKYVKDAEVVKSITLGGPTYVTDIAVKVIMGR